MRLRQGWVPNENPSPSKADCRGCRLWWLFIPAVAIDRLLKRAASAALAPAGVRTAIPGVISWAYTENRGAAFSMLSDRAPWLLIALTAALIVGIVIYLLTYPDAPAPERAGLWLIVGGGLGNLWDRLAHGGVIDFIRLDFIRFAVFNPADVFVCTGAGLVILSVVLTEWRKSHA